MPAHRAATPADLATDPPAAAVADARVADRYPNLGTRGVTVSSSPGADVSILTSRLEGWLVAIGLLAAGALAMGLYLVVLHH
ncbi:MAG TPA: hypothetical protein VMW47_01505 [Verrucomicrobiae bacterium]|nr:hypothetical protein [Verrucomicrobiae bacterium]